MLTIPARSPRVRAWQREAAGFTLIELMVTLSVFVILGLLAMPSFRTWIANNRVRAVAEDMADGLRLAQTEALRRSRQTVFALTAEPDPAGKSSKGALGYAAAATGNNWAVNIAPSKIDDNQGTFVRGGSIADVGSGVTVQGPAAICFDPLGRLADNSLGTGVGSVTCPLPLPSNPPAQVYQINSASADHALQIEVGLGGQVRLCNPAQKLDFGGTAGASEGCQYPPASS